MRPIYTLEVGDLPYQTLCSGWLEAQDEVTVGLAAKKWLQIQSVLIKCSESWEGAVIGLVTQAGTK